MLPVDGMVIYNEPPSELPVNMAYHIILCTISQHMHEKSKHIMLMAHPILNTIQFVANNI